MRRGKTRTLGSMDDPRRYPSREAIREWSRRRSLYSTMTKRLRYVVYPLLLIAIAIVLFAAGDLRSAGLWLFLGTAFLSFVVLQVFTTKYLRCPSCGRVPQVRGGAFYASVCGRCNNYLTADGLPNI